MSLNSSRGKFLAALGCGAVLFGAAGLRAAIIPAYTMTGLTQDTNHGAFSIGYTFTTTQTLTITAFGVLDSGGTSVSSKGSMPVSLYYSTVTSTASVLDPGTVDGGQTSGTAVSGGSATVLSTDPIQSLSGGAYTSGDGFRYHTLTTALVLPAGTYELQSSDLASSFDEKATGLALASGVGTPSNASYLSGSNTAAYGPNVFNANLPRDFGPNFLISTPEPASLAIAAISVVGLLARRRNDRLA